MIDASTSTTAGLLRRLAAWAGERFPARNGVLVLVVWALGVLFGRALTHGGRVGLPLGDLAAFPALWGYFLLLRVLDEHKDYERDLYNHPGRVLQSGQISLLHLKVLGVGAGLLQFLVSLGLDHGIGRITATWALLMIWTTLMAKEFWVRWPPSRFVLYAFMHMLSMPLTLLWLAQIGADGRTLTPGVRWLALLGGLIGAALEVARKFRAPADERPTIDTYTGQLGVRGAGATLAGLLVLSASVAGALIASAVTVSGFVYLGAAACIVPGLVGTLRFVQAPTAERAEAVEATGAISVLLVVVLAVVTLLSARGLA